MIRIGLGVVAAAVAMFFWGFVYWGSGIIDPHRHVSEVGDQSLVAALGANLQETGAYFLPDSKLGGEAAWQERMAEGPVATILFHKGATSPMGMVMGLGFLHMLVAAAMLAGLLLLTRAAGMTYLDRLKIAGGIAALSAVFSYLGNPIWWHHPWSFALTGAVYDFGALFIAGAVLAWFVRPAAA